MKKVISIVSILGLTFLHGLANFAYAAAPTPPPAPSAPTAPTAPEAPSAPTPPPVPAEPSSSTEQTIPEDSQPEPSATPESFPEPSPVSTSSQPPAQTLSGDQTGNHTQDGVSGGDAIIETGDATNNANLVTTGNENLAAGASAGVLGGSGDITILNDGNGPNSDNSGSVGLLNNNLKFQDNSAVVANNLDQTTVTGQNSTSDNTGADSMITTGDANTTGTIITSVNTNVDGVAVAEFNVNDDHMGDIILDFESGCIIGCGSGDVEVANLNNGSYSDNDASLDSLTNNLSFQNNEATIENSLTLESNSGDNIASRNTNGDSQVQTGDANVSANILTMANNNISGNIIYSVVNIFGNLIGDIIFPESELASFCNNCSGDLLAQNSGNGSSSNNNANIDSSINDSTYQFNNANIENNLNVDVLTGQNSASANTNGDTDIETGNVSVDAQVLNVANSNVVGDWWLVIVNEAGNWIGRIMGVPEGATLAGSAGTEFTVDSNGNITASNSGNGTGSNNNANVSQAENNTAVQTNTANLVNNVNLSANTGGNKATDNTGGYSSITTGDANIIANMANFVNNNIAGGGRLFVTVVNVFGSWTGNFLTPGTQKESQQLAQGSANSSNNNGSGGVTQTLSNQSNPNSDNGSGSVSNTLSTTSTTQSQPDGSGNTVLGAFAQVAGFRTEAGGFESAIDNAAASLNASKKAVRINLAWALLALPLIGGFAVMRFRTRHKKLE